MNPPPGGMVGPLHGTTVLVVDDVPRNLQLLGGLLTGQQCEVLFATSGPTALERVAARPPDLVLLDMMMPGMDGLEVCRRLHSNFATRDIPVIFLTASNDTQLAARSLAAGAVDYVSKPFNSAELLARVRTHITLKRTRDELRRIIAQKGELMSVVAHDLKNPIASMRFSALMLRDEGLKPPDPRAELVDTMVEACDSVLAFIQARLERSAREARVERLSPGAVALDALLGQVAGENLPAAHVKQIALELPDAAVALPVVWADAGALSQVLNNLVSNAVKFSPPGSRVEVTVDEPDAAGLVRIAVRDEGPGLTAEDRTHLFEPYRRLSAKPTAGESSTGLGLSIARDLMIEMEGDIGCDSEPGRGARFWVKLPQG